MVRRRSIRRKSGPRRKSDPHCLVSDFDGNLSGSLSCADGYTGSVASLPLACAV